MPTVEKLLLSRITFDLYRFGAIRVDHFVNPNVLAVSILKTPSIYYRDSLNYEEWWKAKSVLLTAFDWKKNEKKMQLHPPFQLFILQSEFN